MKRFHYNIIDNLSNYINFEIDRIILFEDIVFIF